MVVLVIRLEEGGGDIWHAKVFVFNDLTIHPGL